MGSNIKYPSNQQQYQGTLIQCFCKDFDERTVYQKRVKFCKNCSKEYPYCFCKEVCSKETLGSISLNQYEYLTCYLGKCEYLGVRCTSCRTLCTITVLNNEASLNEALTWCCNNADYLCPSFKENFMNSIKKHVKGHSGIKSLDSEIFCKFIYQYIDNFQFMNLLRNLNKSAMLNNKMINEIKGFLTENNPSLAITIEKEAFSLNSTNVYVKHGKNSYLTKFKQDSLSSVKNNLECQKSNRNENMQGDFDIRIITKNEERIEKLEKELKRRFSDLENDLKREYDEERKKIRICIESYQKKNEEALKKINKSIDDIKYQNDQIIKKFGINIYIVIILKPSIIIVINSKY
ncbi:hypothetical protein RclHR1_11300004 [Rhizophagus clarus]|uniref:Uncharacterized protein n=1 Tax=Rhizophagus clarus TaxID=94130 RepID=A0A2Z6Q5F7_9GLOM|nr:hypothetical protein RclHR1_11300004 [Rhizophagus clarus]GES82276.1 hypothetical protein RCL_jg10764.t1 [Rhizophagus clarus]